MPDYPTLIPKTTTPTPETLPGGGIQLPALFSPDSATAQRVLEFFTANIRNPHTRKAYATAVRGFAAWTDTVGIAHLRYIKPLHVAAYIEQLQSRLAAPSVKLQLAAIRMLFDWLVVGQIVPTNPASAVRGPKHSLKKGKTPALIAEEARDLLDSIATRSPVGLRDRALIALMIYTFARVGAVLKMRLEDVFTQGRHTWVRLHEKGGKHHQMPCHHKLESYLQQYIEALEATALEAGSPLDSKAWTFPTAAGRSGRLSNRPMGQADVYRMIRRRTNPPAPPGPGRGHRDENRLPQLPAPPAGRRYRMIRRRGRGHRDENRLPQLPRHRHHGVFAERGQTRSGAADGQPRIRPHHRALRQTQRPGLARRGRADPDLRFISGAGPWCGMSSAGC